MPANRIALIAVSLFGLTSSMAFGQCLELGEIGELPTSHATGEYQAVAYGESTWVAVGLGGEIASSMDSGRTWLAQSNPIAGRDLHDVLFDGEQFVAVGNASIVRSPDGLVWSEEETELELYGVALSDARIVAVGAEGGITWSPDGSQWRVIELDEAVDQSLFDLAWRTGLYVAVGADGLVMTSPNGDEWTRESPVPIEFPQSLFAIESDGESFVAVGGDFASLIVRSLDGVNWNIELVGAGGRDSLRDLAVSDGRFMAVGEQIAETDLPYVRSSSGGIDWSEISIDADLVGGLSAIGSGAGSWLALGEEIDHALAYEQCPESQWLPIVASLEGAAGSRWRSDLTVRNASDDSARVELTLHHDDGIDRFLEQDIAAGAQAVWVDVVANAFASGGKGSLEILSSEELAVSARIYNQSELGSFGQLMPAYRPSAALQCCDPVQLLHLRQLEGEYRSNLTFANLGSDRSTLGVWLYASDGTQVGQFVVELAAGQVIQEVEPFVNRADQANLGWGFAEVAIISGESVAVSASVIDSRTNDPVTILPLPVD